MCIMCTVILVKLVALFVVGVVDKSFVRCGKVLAMVHGCVVKLTFQCDLLAVVSTVGDTFSGVAAKILWFVCKWCSLSSVIIIVVVTIFMALLCSVSLTFKFLPVSLIKWPGSHSI